MLGNTTKDGDVNQIGSFGEGYKLAMLVLARDGFDVTINNYAKKEVWAPKIIRSRRYDSDLLVVDVNKGLFKSKESDNLVFEIKGVTQDMFYNIKSHMLFLQDGLSVIETDRGEVLLDEDKQGHIYVNGLFIEKMRGNVLFGYNMKAKAISLDRDRKAVDVFQLTWDTSWMWSKLAKTHPDMFKDLLSAGSLDIQYIISSGTNANDVEDIAYDDFVNNYGVNAIPVDNQIDHDEASRKYPSADIVIVPTLSRTLIRKSQRYISNLSNISTVTKKTPYEILSNFYENYRDVLTTDAAHDFNEILESSVDWNNS